MFIVWKRSDGLVSASKATSLDRWPIAKHRDHTFEVLGTFLDTQWDEARDLIEKMRKEIPQPDFTKE